MLLSTYAAAACVVLPHLQLTSCNIVGRSLLAMFVRAAVCCVQAWGWACGYWEQSLQAFPGTLVSCCLPGSSWAQVGTCHPLRTPTENCLGESARGLVMHSWVFAQQRTDRAQGRSSQQIAVAMQELGMLMRDLYLNVAHALQARRR